MQTHEVMNSCRDTQNVECFRRKLEIEYPLLEAQLRSTGEILDNAMLLRWIDARGHETCIRKLVEHAEWRRNFVGEGHENGIQEERIMNLLEDPIVFLQGNDTHGHPVVIFLARNYDVVKYGDSISLLMAYAIDKALVCADTVSHEENPKKQIVWIFDLLQVSRRNLSIEMLRMIFDLLQTHYPECLKKLYFTNAPLLFGALWSCVSGFLSHETRNKIDFVSATHTKAYLCDALGKQILPEEYGGSHDWIPVHVTLNTNSIHNAKEHTADPSCIFTLKPPKFSFISFRFWVVFSLALILWVLKSTILNIFHENIFK